MQKAPDDFEEIAPATCACLFYSVLHSSPDNGLQHTSKDRCMSVVVLEDSWKVRLLSLLLYRLAIVIMKTVRQVTELALWHRRRYRSDYRML